MKAMVNGIQKDILTVWMKRRAVYMIDQNLLPYRLRILRTTDYMGTFQAIRDMSVRGAGAIAVAAAFGLVQAANQARNEEMDVFRARLGHAAAKLKDSRPTAVNLGYAIDRCLSVLGQSTDVTDAIRAVKTEAQRISREDLQASKRIGEIGAELIRDGDGILTHCNAGALAFVDYGTALSPIRTAYKSKKRIKAYVDETRPRSQGARLTAWELQQESIPYAIIVDSAAGYLMKNRKIQLVLVGADRIARNGDTANKIGTYQLAVLAHENGIPFYVAAPTTTFDLHIADGDEIPIEERDPCEVTWVSGEDEQGKLRHVRIAPKGSEALNPAFDVTPATYVTGFITERGFIAPSFLDNIHATLKQAERNV